MLKWFLKFSNTKNKVLAPKTVENTQRQSPSLHSSLICTFGIHIIAFVCIVFLYMWFNTYFYQCTSIIRQGDNNFASTIYVLILLIFFLFSQQRFVDKISQVLHFFLTIGILMAPRPYPYMGCPIRPLIGRFIPRNIIGPPPIPMDPPPLTGCIPPRIGFIPPLTSKSPPPLLPYKTQGL